MEHLMWQVGDVRITRIAESLTSLPFEVIFPKATPEALARHASWLEPHFSDGAGNFDFSIQALVIESEGRRIIVDTGLGEHPVLGLEAVAGGGPGSGPQNDLLQVLNAAGFPPASFDFVLCTHLHIEHIGGNTKRVDGLWVPTFPRARYLLARKEWEFWEAEEERPFAHNLDNAILPVLDAGLADLVALDHRITDSVKLVSTPGHSAGHVSVEIESRGERAFITGDLTHHPLQWVQPSWGVVSEYDTHRAAETRARFAERYANSGALVIGTHYPAPTAGFLVRERGELRFETGH